jgi:hypothetical protein
MLVGHPMRWNSDNGSRRSPAPLSSLNRVHWELNPGDDLFCEL